MNWMRHISLGLHATFLIFTCTRFILGNTECHQFIFKSSGISSTHFPLTGRYTKEFFIRITILKLIPSEQTVTEFSAIGTLEETDIGRTNPEMKTLKITFSVKSLAHL